MLRRLTFLAVLAVTAPVLAADPASLVFETAEFTLGGPRAEQQLVVTGIRSRQFSKQSQITKST